MLFLTVAILRFLTQALAQTITAPAAATTLDPSDCSSNTYVRPSFLLPKLH
jgi:hypothetical protein